jgi:hypothetical protein
MLAGNVGGFLIGVERRRLNGSDEGVAQRRRDADLGRGARPESSIAGATPLRKVWHWWPVTLADAGVGEGIGKHDTNFTVDH